MGREAEVVKSVLEGRAAVKPSSQSIRHNCLRSDCRQRQCMLCRKRCQGPVPKGDAVSGFKGGLTAEAGQKKFGVNEALMGQLLKSGELGPDSSEVSGKF